MVCYLKLAELFVAHIPQVRNRAKELVELLGDVDKIRTERRKAKTNKSKYTGVGNDAMSFNSSSYEFSH